VGTRCANHVTPLYPQKLALTSPTGGGRSVGMVRSRTKATEKLEREGGQDHAPPTLPLGYLVPIVQRDCWTLGPLWTIAENLVPPEFGTRTIQPVATRFQDYNAAIYARNKVRHL